MRSRGPLPSARGRRSLGLRCLAPTHGSITSLRGSGELLSGIKLSPSASSSSSPRHGGRARPPRARGRFAPAVRAASCPRARATGGPGLLALAASPAIAARAWSKGSAPPPTEAAGRWQGGRASFTLANCVQVPVYRPAHQRARDRRQGCSPPATQGLGRARLGRHLPSPSPIPHAGLARPHPRRSACAEAFPLRSQFVHVNIALIASAY